MDTNSMIIVSGLVALLVSYAAVHDSQGGWRGSVGPMRWSFSGSWASSVAAVLALVLTLFGMDASGGPVLGLGLVLVLAPLVYRGMAGDAGVSKLVFFIVSSLITWATLSILYVAATSVPDLIESLPVLTTIIIDAALVLALVGAVMNSARTLATAVSGDGSEAWTLP